MFKINYCLCFVFLIVGVWTAEDHCDYKGKRIENGETVPAPIGECTQLTCNDGDIVTLNCPPLNYIADAACTTTEENLSLEYPACCATVECHGAGPYFPVVPDFKPDESN